MTTYSLLKEKARFLDLGIAIVIFLSSFYISSHFPSSLFSILILLSFGYISQAVFIKSHSMSITEHIIVGVGVGLLIMDSLMATLVYAQKAVLFKEVLLGIFLIIMTVALTRRIKMREFKGCYIDKIDVFPWIIVVSFFFGSVALRHAIFRFPDEYIYLDIFEYILTDKGLYTSEVSIVKIQHFFLFSYAGLLKFAKLTFRSTEVITLFFVSMSLIPTYLLGNKLFGRKVGYLAMIFLAFNPSFIQYSIRLLSWALSTFLIISYLYFFYKWYENRNRLDLLISFVFIVTGLFVKFHGIVFLGISLIYLLLVLDKKEIGKIRNHLLVAAGAFFLILIIANIPELVFKFIQVMINDIKHRYLIIGYRTYRTFFAPDLYTLPLVILAFFGVSSILYESRRKKLFLLLPVLVFVIISTGNPYYTGVRHFLVVVPLISLLAAYGTLHHKKYSALTFVSLVYFYTATLAIMAIYAPTFPHLDHVRPHIPLQIRLATFYMGGIVLALKLLSIKKERLTQKSMYFIISLVIVSSLLNANYFVNVQQEYPDNKRTGLDEAGKWLSENTPLNARIQSITWESSSWMDIHKYANPEMPYSKSTFLSYYVDRVTYAPPETEDLFLKRIENKDVDYIVAFTDSLLTTSDAMRSRGHGYIRLQMYVKKAPPGTELVYTGYDESQEVLFRVYKVV